MQIFRERRSQQLIKVNDNLKHDGRKKKMIQIHCHSVVNSKGSLETIRYKTFENADQQAACNATIDISSWLCGHLGYQYNLNISILNIEISFYFF